jgi:uncharacterized membrane protein YdbT with pleckstrin-like domain
MTHAQPAENGTADEEQDILMARPTMKAFLGEVIVGCLLAPVGIGLIIIAAVWYKTRALRYRLTNERLFVHKGLIAKCVEEIELFRVKDQSMRQGLIQRLLGFGSITVLSTDDSTPVLNLVGINNPMAVKERIRSAVRKARKQSGVRMTEFAQS